MEREKVILLGAGGHAAVVADIVRRTGRELFGYLDDGKEIGSRILNAPVLGRISDCQRFPGVKFVIAIGQNETRRQIAERYPLDYATLVHPAAIIGAEVSIGRGCVVMAGAVINARSKIGIHGIINTGAIVEHDNQIGNFVHLSPRVTLGGSVLIGDGTHIGMGAVVKNGTAVGAEVVVGAGAVVIKEIQEAGIYVGVPAKRIR